MNAPAPPSHAGRPGGLLDVPAIVWLRKNLFSNWISTAATLLIGYFVLKFVIGFLAWGVFGAVWSLDGQSSNVCREMRGSGACWALIGENYRFILFGTYPFQEQWRPALVVLLFISLYVVSALRRFWNSRLIIIWVVGLTAIGVLMWGGILGLQYVEQERWGGLPITLILATFGIVIAFPVGILLALGRRSHMPAIKAICVAYIELIRGVPLITLLFMASVMFPLFLPEGLTIDKLLRAQVAIIMFAAAYQAEVIRGGLQSISKGQYEAADALGLGYWQKTGFIILPQALRIVIPPMVNSLIAMFKDTSLVVIIGLYDLMNAAKASFVDPAWRGASMEAYVFVGLIYFVFCFFMSKYSQGLESRLAAAQKR